MSSAFPTYTILLSVRSPILAPLYLAKVRGNAFRNIDFKYAFELPAYGAAQKADPKRDVDVLARCVLSKSPETRQYIAGIADPFRCLMRTDGAMYKPKVLANIIRHQTFWLASDDEELKHGAGLDAARQCDYIISQPSYTSGYTVLTNFLDLKSVETQDPDFDQLENGPKIFHRTLPGFEREFYQSIRKKSCKDGKYAYLTTNPADHDGPIVSFSNLRHGEHDAPKDYRDTLMSALFCGNGWYRKYPALFDDIRSDIEHSIEAIILDPIRAAVELKDYSRISGDRFINFSNDVIAHPRLVEILDDLIRDGVYAPDLSFTPEQIERGVALRPRFRESGSAPAAMFAHDPAQFLQEFFDAAYIKPAPAAPAEAGPEPIGDRDRTEGLPAFAREAARNYREIVDKFYATGASMDGGRLGESGGGRTMRARLKLAWLLLAAALAARGALGFLHPGLFGQQNQTNPGVENLLCAIASLILLAPAYLIRYSNQARKSLRYDFILLLTLSVDAAMTVWAVLAFLNPGLNAGAMQLGDKLSLELFFVSTSTLIFGAFGLAARDRIAQWWETVVLRWVEWRILVFRVGHARVPPRKCGRTRRCARCMLANWGGK